MHSHSWLSFWLSTVLMVSMRLEIILTTIYCIRYYMPDSLHILSMYISWNVYAYIYVMLISWKPCKVDNAIIFRLKMMLLGDLEKVDPCLLVSNTHAFWGKTRYCLAQWFSMCIQITWGSISSSILARAHLSSLSSGRWSGWVEEHLCPNRLLAHFASHPLPQEGA